MPTGYCFSRAQCRKDSCFLYLVHRLLEARPQAGNLIGSGPLAHPSCCRGSQWALEWDHRLWKVSCLTQGSCHPDRSALCGLSRVRHLQSLRVVRRHVKYDRRFSAVPVKGLPGLRCLRYGHGWNVAAAEVFLAP